MNSIEKSSVESKQAHLWLNSVPGQYLQASEQAVFDAAVFDLFGFNALQMGMAQIHLLQNSRIAHRFVASEDSSEQAHLYCADDFLPLADMSLDVLLLPHRLEFSERPHQTLREAARVIMPEGHLLITGFNPWSTWGLKSYLKKIIQFLKVKKNNSTETFFNKNSWQDYPWHARMIRLARLKDWLALLNFEVVLVEKICHAPPFSHEHWLKKCGWLDEFVLRHLRRVGLDRFGGVYFIVAKKRVPGMTPLKPKWKKSPLTAALAHSPKPSQQQQRQEQKPPSFKQSTIIKEENF